MKEISVYSFEAYFRRIANSIWGTIWKEKITRTGSKNYFTNFTSEIEEIIPRAIYCHTFILLSLLHIKNYSFLTQKMA